MFLNQCRPTSNVHLFVVAELKVFVYVVRIRLDLVIVKLHTFHFSTPECITSNLHYLGSEQAKIIIDAVISLKFLSHYSPVSKPDVWKETMIFTLTH